MAWFLPSGRQGGDFGKVRGSEKMSDKISKHDYNVKAIALINAHFLVTEYHYSKSSACTAVYSHGMFDKDGWIVGAAMWMPQLMKASVRTSQEAGFSDHRGVLHLSRLVCVPDLPGNSASFLLGRSMRLIDRKRCPVVVTYADIGMGHLVTIYAPGPGMRLLRGCR